VYGPQRVRPGFVATTPLPNWAGVWDRVVGVVRSDLPLLYGSKSSGMSEMATWVFN
jgi:hypothetical protein